MVTQGFGPIPGAVYKPSTRGRSNIHTLASLPPASTDESELFLKAMALQATAREQTTLVNLQEKEVRKLTEEMTKIEQRQDHLDRENQALIRRVNRLKKLAGCAIGVVTGLGLLVADSGVSAYRIILNSVIGGTVGMLIVSEYNRKKGE